MTKLFSMQRLQYFKPLRCSEMERNICSVWQDVSNAQNIQRKLQVWACNVISRMALGKSLNDISKSTKMEGSLLLDALCESSVLIGSPNLNDFLPILNFVDIQHVKQRTDTSFEKLDTIFQRIIDDRRNSRAAIDGYDYKEKDLLDTLLSTTKDKGDMKKGISLTDDNIKAILWVCIWTCLIYCHCFIPKGQTL